MKQCFTASSLLLLCCSRLRLGQAAKMEMEDQIWELQQSTEEQHAVLEDLHAKLAAAQVLTLLLPPPDSPLATSTLTLKPPGMKAKEMQMVQEKADLVENLSEAVGSLTDAGLAVPEAPLGRTWSAHA